MARSTALSRCALAALTITGSVQAQMHAYWADATGAPLRDAAAQCLRSAQWSALSPHPACDAIAPKPARPDRVVLLPSPYGKVGAVLVQSPKGQQLVNTAFGGVAVATDGQQTATLEDAAAVQARYGALLASQPARPLNFVVRFAAGSATQLTPESLTVLDEIKQALSTRAAPEITVIGHTDRVGSEVANDVLSLKRAQAVQQMLASAGLSGARIEAAGRGEREPLVPTSDEVAEPRNRRVELNLR